jgi:NAD(P)-dependent dehydrogenase (short-subunit alcohol dehydrogenase family)
MVNNKPLVIITGANGNLGSAVTGTFLSKGYRVVATVLEDGMKKDFEPNDDLEIQVVDLTNEEAASGFVNNIIKAKGVVDAALMLVGGFAGGDIKKTALTDIKKQITLNFDTAYNVAKPLTAHMQENKKGKLVFIGSRPALNASQGKDLVAYALSKSLLFRLAELINETCKGTDVTATVIAPSTLDTALNRKYMPDVDPETWVKPTALAEVMAFIVGENGTVLRETVLKAYNNA